MEYRVEKKYICTNMELAILKARLQAVMSIDKNQKEIDAYQIRSIYFDNYDNSSYFENDAGVDDRKKLRIRVYNKSRKTIKLEVKEKYRNLTKKKSCCINEEEFQKILLGKCQEFLYSDREVLRMFAVAILNYGYHPVNIIEYDRTAFTYPIGNVRITFDKNIAASEETNKLFDDNLQKIPLLPVDNHILEIKHDELIPDFILQLLELGNLQQMSFSKYYMGRSILNKGEIV